MKRIACLKIVPIFSVAFKMFLWLLCSAFQNSVISGHNSWSKMNSFLNDIFLIFIGHLAMIHSVVLASIGWKNGSFKICSPWVEYLINIPLIMGAKLKTRCLKPIENCRLCCLDVLVILQQRVWNPLQSTIILFWCFSLKTRSSYDFKSTK